MQLRKVEHLGLGYTIEITYCPAYVAQNLACLASRNDLFDRYYGIYGYANTADLTFDLIGIDLKGKYSNARTAFLKHFLISGMEVLMFQQHIIVFPAVLITLVKIF